MGKIFLKLTYVLITGYLLISQTACKKFIEVPVPSTSTNKDIVFSTDESAIATLTAIYSRMSQKGINSGITSISYLSGLSADELMLNAGVNLPVQLSYYKNLITSGASSSGDIWSDSYYIIFMANSAIEGLNSSSTLTQAIKQQLLGEAKFVRAFCYFYLVNLYGDVPLVLTSDYKINSNIGRSAKQKVYNQIIADLKEAQILLNTDYLDAKLVNSSQERTTPNKWVATALLARTYLYIKDYANAITQASNVIGHNDLYDLVSIDNVFLKNNKEAIWQIQSVSNVFSNTIEARVFILPATGPNTTNFPVYLIKDFELLFDSNDKRKSSWLGSSLAANGVRYYYPFKYKINALFAVSTEYTVTLRLAEQYLIRAEAYSHLGNLEDAKDDLNRIRERAGVAQIVVTDKATMLSTIMSERQKELFTEWGHRWLDLKRTETIDAVMPSVVIKKGANWEPFKQLYPIPQTEIERNPALAGQQNLGYN